MEQREQWIDAFCDRIPVQNYSAQVEAGDLTGLLIHLYGAKYQVELKLGLVFGVNMIEEGIQLNDLPGIDSEQDILPKEDFSSTIYLVNNGRYARYIEACLGNDLVQSHKLRQYNIVTQNYVIMAVCSCEPEINVIPIERE